MRQRKLSARYVRTHGRATIDDAASILRSLTESGGFLGAAVMAPSGELLAQAPRSQRDMAVLAALANNVLLHAKDTMAGTRTGSARTVHVEGTAGDILVACSGGLTDNETGSSDLLHFHLVILMRADGNVGKARS